MNFTSKPQSVITLLSLALLGMVAGCAMDNPIDYSIAEYPAAPTDDANSDNRVDEPGGSGGAGSGDDSGSATGDGSGSDSGDGSEGGASGSSSTSGYDNNSNSSSGSNLGGSKLSKELLFTGYTSDVHFSDIEIDSKNNLYVTGHTKNGYTPSDYTVSSCSSNPQMFYVRKYTENGQIDWEKNSTRYILSRNAWKTYFN